MLSLGNMYFANLSSNPERYIKDSYKFFHHVLTKDPKNVYAANGLGVVCAEKGEFDVAREIISRVRIFLAELEYPLLPSPFYIYPTFTSLIPRQITSLLFMSLNFGVSSSY